MSDKISDKIALTPSAVARLKAIAAEKKLDNVALRIVIDGGGCSGFQYDFKLDSQKLSDDLEFETDGAVILIDKISFEFVKGAQVDFKESMMGSAFVINNPNASSACGCGNSFTI